MLRVIDSPLTDLDMKLSYIRNFLRAGSEDDDIRMLASNILREAGLYQVSLKDPWSVATALYRWVKRNVPFQQDPVSGQVVDLSGMRVEGPVDLIQNPMATLGRGRGDCVALTILLGSLVGAVGIPVQVGLQAISDEVVDHVLLMVGLPLAAPQEWFPLDLTEQEPGVYRKGGPVSMVRV